MRSDALRLGAVLLVLSAVVLALTRIDAAPDTAQVRAVAASGAAALENSTTGDAVLRVGDLDPGQSLSGTVTIENPGDATGRFRLAQTDVLDVPGSGGARLSRALRLRVENARTRQQIYRGALGAMNPLQLGYLRGGQRATYRFRLALPERAKPGPLAGSRVEATFDWTAVTADPPAPDRDSPPTLIVQSTPVTDGRSDTVTLALTCSRRCRVAGLSRGATVASRAPLLPGRPALREVRLSPSDAKRLERGEDVELAVTAAGAADRTTSVPVTLGLAR